MIQSRPMFYSNQHFIGIKNIVKLQLIFGLSCVIFTAIIIKNFSGVLSAFLGLLLALMPTIAYIKIAFAKGLVDYPSVVLGRHQKAMLLKFLLNIILFALVFISYKQCNFFALFATYFITLSGYWVSLIKK